VTEEVAMGPRAGCRTLATILAAVVGMVLLSGSDQPVTAQSYPRWQTLPSPPLTPRTHALGVPAPHRVLVLGGLSAGVPAQDGAAYDLRTGIWRLLRVPIAVTDRDSAVVAAGVVVLQHVRAGGPASWWRYDVRRDAWARLRPPAPRLSVPAAFGSEVYAVSGRRVFVYSVQLGRWTALHPDPFRPALTGATVTASRDGIVITGHPAGRPHRKLADRWEGLHWHRSLAHPTELVTAPPDGATRVRLAGRTLVVRDGRAWIRLP
jgi:hypothetical protein